MSWQQWGQQILDLGEQKPKPVNVSGRDLDSLSQPELITLCGSMQQQLETKSKEFDQLQSESIVLRKEYDDFRRKADDWQAQMKVTRDNDRRLIEQLKSAAQEGESTDEVMSHALQETVTKLREELRAVQEDRAREARRRTDAELSMQRMEQENKREVATLKQNFDSLKGKMREQQVSANRVEQQQQQQIRELRDKLMSARATVERLEEASSEEKEQQQQQNSNKKIAASDASGPSDASDSKGGVEGADSSSSSSSAAAAAAATSTPASPSEQRTPVNDENTSKLTEKVRQLQSEKASLLDRLSAAEKEAQQSCDAAADSRRRVQQLELDKQDLDNGAAQLRLEIESLQTKCTKLGAQLEEKDEEAGKIKRQWQQQQKSLESAADEERALRTKAAARFEAQLEQLRHDLREAKEAAADKDQAVTDAAVRAKASVTEGETHRQQLEAALIALEGKLQEATSRRVAVEGTLSETQAEIRRRNSVIDELRQEQDRMQQRLEEADAQVLVMQKATAARERDVIARDRQVQALETDVENEKRETQRLRQQMEELQESLAAAQVKVVQLKKEKQQHQQQQQQQSRNVSETSFSSISPLPQQQGSTAQQHHHNHQPKRAGSAERNDDSSNSVDEHDLTRSPSPPGASDADADRWASATREWLGRLDHERRVAAEAVRVREEQSAKLRHMESRVDELTFKLSAAEAVATSLGPGQQQQQNSSSSSGMQHGASVPMPQTASSVLLSHGPAWHQQMLSTVQQRLSSGGWLSNRKGIFALAMVFFVVIVIFNFIAAGQTASANKDLETLATVKDKYFRCLEVVARCKQSPVA